MLLTKLSWNTHIAKNQQIWLKYLKKRGKHHLHEMKCRIDKRSNHNLQLLTAALSHSVTDLFRLFKLTQTRTDWLQSNLIHFFSLSLFFLFFYWQYSLAFSSIMISHTHKHMTTGPIAHVSTSLDHVDSDIFHLRNVHVLV